MRPIEDITAEGISLIDSHKHGLVHALSRIFILFIIAVLLEVFLFNMNYFRSAGYQSVDLSKQASLDLVDPAKAAELGLGQTSQMKFTESSHVAEFHNLNKPIHNIHLDFDNNQAAQDLKVQISFTDAAHETYFNTTEYTFGVPEVDVSTASEECQYLYLESSGDIDDLRIEIINDENTTYPIILNSIRINDPQPFSFNTLRFFIAFVILLFLYAFRPKSSIYKCFIKEHPRFSRAVVVLATGCEILVLCAYLFFGSNQVGVATSFYNSGSWDGHSIVNTYQVGGDNAQQYAELAKAMAHGQLYLEEEPPQWLQDMDNPYDKGARDELQKQTGEPYLFDVAYHDGHYYVYFGVLPVLLFYLPFYLLTGSSFPTAIGVLISCIAFILGATALMDRFARYHFKRMSLGLFLLLQMPLVACSGMLYLAKFPTFYSLPIALAMALTVWGLYFWVHGRSSNRAWGWYLAGSLCMALVVACRPQFIVFSLVAFPLFWRKFITERHLFTPQGIREFICLLAPYAVVAIGVMMYNKARFGSLTDFGANYNLTVNDMTQRGTNPGRFLPALFAYFLQTPTTTGVFPWIQPAPFDTTYLGQTIKEVTFGGILVCLPILWILAFAKPILAYRFKVRSTHTIAGVVVVMLVAAVIVACMDAQMAGILQRYTADYSSLFLIPAALLVFVANDALSHKAKTAEEKLLYAKSHTLFLRVIQVLVALSLLYSTLVCLVPETGWYSDVYGWAYQDIIEMVEFWT